MVLYMWRPLGPVSPGSCLRGRWRSWLSHLSNTLCTEGPQFEPGPTHVALLSILFAQLLVTEAFHLFQVTRPLLVRKLQVYSQSYTRVNLSPEGRGQKPLSSFEYVGTTDYYLRASASAIVSMRKVNKTKHLSLIRASTRRLPACIQCVCIDL